MFESLGRASFVTFTVLPDTHEPIDDRQHGCNGRCDDHGLEARCISWSIFRLEEEGADEIAYWK